LVRGRLNPSLAKGRCPEKGRKGAFDNVISELSSLANPEKVIIFHQFFQAFPGGYGEGDQFAGIKVPHLRHVAKQFYSTLSFDETEQLLRHPIHEYRLTALFILTYQYEKGSPSDKEKVVEIYLRNTAIINNWDLVDASAHKILGHYYFDKDRALFYQLAASKDLWEQRISIISTFCFIRQHQYEDSLNIAKILLVHPHDLIHKAVGWMLREVGNRDYDTEYQFLEEHYHNMPRTMLRYAIEKFSEPVRQQFLKGKI